MIDWSKIIIQIKLGRSNSIVYIVMAIVHTKKMVKSESFCWVITHFSLYLD